MHYSTRLMLMHWFCMSTIGAYFPTEIIGSLSRSLFRLQEQPPSIRLTFSLVPLPGLEPESYKVRRFRPSLYLEPLDNENLLSVLPRYPRVDKEDTACSFPSMQ